MTAAVYQGRPGAGSGGPGHRMAGARARRWGGAVGGLLAALAGSADLRYALVFATGMAMLAGVIAEAYPFAASEAAASTATGGGGRLTGIAPARTMVVAVLDGELAVPCTRNPL